jgi:hypothetical protein
MQKWYQQHRIEQEISAPSEDLLAIQTESHEGNGE